MAEYKPSPSTQQFQSHQIHALAKQWSERLLAQRPNNIRELADDPRDAYVRLRWVVRELRARIKKLHPMLAQRSVLDGISQRLAALEAHWNQYRANPIVFWQQLNNQTDTLIANVRNLPSSDGVAPSVETLDELSADMNGAIKGAQETVNGLQATATATDKKYQEAQAKLQNFESEIQAQKTRLDLMITQQGEAFSKAEQGRAAQFTKVEQDRLAKFIEAQEQKKVKFEATVAEFEKSNMKTIQKHEEEFSAIEGTSRSKSDELLLKINGQLDKAVEIVGTIVKTTMSGNYQIIANREYRNAWAMRGVAIAGFLALGGMVIWAVSLMKVGPNGIDWSTFAFRLSLATAFLVPGLYCAKESSRHWLEEKHNRRISLELAALDPFIVKLDEAKQKQIIEKMADEYFGRGAAHEMGEDQAAWKKMQFSADQLFNLAERIAKILHAK
ncbi:MAG: hypothetical protein ACYCPQ_10415 [Elusimicrobiota bacterium]